MVSNSQYIDFPDILIKVNYYRDVLSGMHKLLLSEMLDTVGYLNLSIII